MSSDTPTAPAARSRALGGLRRALTTAGIAGALLAGGVALPATASAAVPAAHGPTLVRTAFDGDRANRALAETGKMYRDAGECAVKAVGKSLWRNRKKPTLPGIALGTVKPAVKCGRSKGH